MQRIEQFAEVSMLKSKMVEENLKKMEYEATNINQNYFNKEN